MFELLVLSLDVSLRGNFHTENLKFNPLPPNGQVYLINYVNPFHLDLTDTPIGLSGAPLG